VDDVMVFSDAGMTGTLGPDGNLTGKVVSGISWGIFWSWSASKQRTRDLISERNSEFGT
jgi:hypothetical protein